jgi:hypothetical protein
MNNECSDCDKTYKSSKALNEHRAYMRRACNGHAELKRLKSKTEVGSCLGDQDTKMDDVEAHEK